MRHIGVLGNWKLSDLKPDEIRDATAKLIEEIKAKYDAIAAVKPEDVTFENCIRVRTTDRILLVVAAIKFPSFRSSP